MVAAGHSAIIDAVFARADERQAAEHAAASLRVPFTGLFLTADLDSRIRRIGGRTRDASEADATVARTQEGYDLGDLNWTRADASGTPEETFRRVKAVIR